MAECAPLLLRIVSSSVSAANRAGQIIRDVLEKGDLGIIDKGHDDPQTEADRSSQRCIIASLLAKYPRLTIIGEEKLTPTTDIPSDWIANQTDESITYLKCPSNLTNIKEEDVVVWVDPLDGTGDFAQGFLENATVLIGVAVHDIAVGGVIHQPFYKDGNQQGRTLWGIDGVGYGGFTMSPPPSEKLILTTTRTHSNPVVEEVISILKPDQVLRVGGAGYKVLLLIEGKAHAYVFASPGSKRWDSCAPEAILKTIGGVLTDIHGQTYSYSKSTPYSNSLGILAAASEAIHRKCCAVIPEGALK